MIDDAQTVIAAITSYRARILETDRRVQRFLSDRQKYPYPHHQELIDEIRQFENRIHRIRFGFQNTEVHMRLESLMHSLLVYEQSWKRMFGRDGEAYEQAHAPRPPAPRKGDAEDSHPLIDKAYRYARKRWAEEGIHEIESKAQLARRLLPAYKAAKSKLKKGERLAVVYDPESRQVTLAVRSETGSVAD